METYILCYELFNKSWQEEVQEIGAIGYIVAQKLEQGCNEVTIRIKQ